MYTRGTTVVIERDRCEIEKETGRRGASRLCSETRACLINDIDKTVNRERNSLPSVIYLCARWTDMRPRYRTRFGILSRLAREKKFNITSVRGMSKHDDKLEYVIGSGGCNFSYFYIFYCAQYNSNIIMHLIKKKKAILKSIRNTTQINWKICTMNETKCCNPKDRNKS